MSSEGREPAVRKWEELARKRPEFAVLTDGRVGPEFWRSGISEVRSIIDTVKSVTHLSLHRALDFGCGLGRLSFPLGQYFEDVLGLDHSPTMIQLAQKRAQELGVTNVRFSLTQGPFDRVSEGTVSFVVSRLVFQHIPNWDTIVRVCIEVRRVLASDGLAWLHFDSRSETLAYRAWNWIEPRLPPFVGPRTRRAPLRRYRRRAAELDGLFSSLGLVAVWQRGRNSENHEYLLRREVP